MTTNYQKFLKKRLIEIRDNWERILAICGVVGICIIQILGEFIPTLKSNNLVIYVCIYMIGFAIIFLILDIHKSIHVKSSIDFESNLISAIPRMVEYVCRELARSGSKQDLEIRVVGMRLMGISQFMAALAHKLKTEQPLKRKINITVYHIDEQFISEMCTKSVDVANTFKNHASLMHNQLRNITDMFTNINGVSISFHGYKSIPYFWAIDISKKTIFWGHFLWDNLDNNWIGPENRCFIFDMYDNKLEGLAEGVINRIDSYEFWSSKTEI